MLVYEDSLPEVYRYAIAERQRGQTYIYVSLEPRIDVAKFVQLWEGIVGTVVGREYYEEPDFNPDLPSNRTVSALRIRVRITDVVEAMRRFKKREHLEMKEPSLANAVRVRKVADTMR